MQACDNMLMIGAGKVFYGWGLLKALGKSKARMGDKFNMQVGEITYLNTAFKPYLKTALWLKLKPNQPRNPLRNL